MFKIIFSLLVSFKLVAVGSSLTQQFLGISLGTNQYAKFCDLIPTHTGDELITITQGNRTMNISYLNSQGQKIQLQNFTLLKGTDNLFECTRAIDGKSYLTISAWNSILRVYYENGLLKQELFAMDAYGGSFQGFTIPLNPNYVFIDHTHWGVVEEVETWIRARFSLYKKGSTGQFEEQNQVTGFFSYTGFFGRIRHVSFSPISGNLQLMYISDYGGNSKLYQITKLTSGDLVFTDITARLHLPYPLVNNTPYEQTNPYFSISSAFIGIDRLITVGQHWSPNVYDYNLYCAFGWVCCPLTSLNTNLGINSDDIIPVFGEDFMDVESFDLNRDGILDIALAIEGEDEKLSNDVSFYYLGKFDGTYEGPFSFTRAGEGLSFSNAPENSSFKSFGIINHNWRTPLVSQRIFGIR